MKAKVFVYGTLRAGHGNFQWLEPAVSEVIPNVTTPGKLFHLPGGVGGFPLARFDPDATSLITGDVLVVDIDDEVWDQVACMEINAGYVPTQVKVLHSDEVAIAFHFPDTDRNRVGAEIPSGDWNQYDPPYFPVLEDA